MDIESYLKQYYKLEKRIEYLNLDIELLKIKANSACAPVLSDMPKSPNPPQEAYFAKMLELIWDKEEKLKEEMELFNNLNIEIDEILSQIEDVNILNIFVLKYKHHKSWSDIGRIVYADRRTVKKWWKETMKDLELPKDFIKI